MAAKLAKSDDENESLTDLTESDENEEKMKLDFWILLTHNAISVDPSNILLLLLDELDDGAVTYILIIFMHHQNCY